MARIDDDRTKSHRKISRLDPLRHTFPPLVQPALQRRSTAHGDTIVTAYAAAEYRAA